MGNLERGEIDITVNRKVDGEWVPKEYTLKLSVNAAVSLEAKLKKPIGKLLSEASELDFTAIRELIFTLLQKFHGDEIKNVTEAGNFIDDAGGVKVFFETLERLSKVNAPEKAEGAAGENPPLAQDLAGGDVSTSTLAH